MEDILVGTLVPISICAVLPIMIIYLITRQKINNDNKRANVLIKAIEANNNIDADKLAEALNKPKKTPREILNRRLLYGCMFTLAGIGLSTAGIIGLCNGTEFGADPVSIPIISGMICLALGISYLIVFFVTRKQVDCTENNQ